MIHYCLNDTSLADVLPHLEKRGVAICRQHGSNIGKLALQFSVANPSIPTNIIGIANPARILQYLRELDEPLDQELLKGVLKILEPVRNLI